VAALNRATGGSIAKAMELAGFEGKPEQLAWAAAPKTGAGKALLVGMGAAGEIQAKTVREAFGRAASACQDKGLKTAAVVVPTARGLDVEAAAAALAEGMELASYDPGLYKTDEGEKKKPALRRVLLLDPGGEGAAALRRGVQRGQALADGVVFTRTLVNKPSNELTPRLMARAARELARSPLVKVKVAGPAEIRKMGMGGLVGVGQGSDEPYQFIQLEYRPKRLPRGAPKIALVGKGITFDTGGISLKPAPNMDQMKFDMGGAGAVLGAFRILAALQPPAHVLGFVAAAENMPSGKAIKPGDLLRMMNGMTVEVNNTDAEGRLVLADALHHAKQQKPDFMVDAATLTGACLIALGDVACGLMTEDERLAKLILKAGEASGDTAWRLPLMDVHRKKMKGHVADLKNTGPREGGALTAAGFLSHFATGVPWAHLDIAGTVWTDEARAVEPKGATGFGARLFYSIVELASEEGW
jgi:leucyl aminopeptidase